MNKKDVIYEVPFVTQRVTEESFLSDGFDNLNDAMHWHERGCGIACLRMVVKYFRPKKEISNYKSLIDEGIKIGAYCDKGWIHKGIAKLAKSYDLDAKDHRKMSSEYIFKDLKEGSICVASVSVCFNQKVKGGHLIVVNGYRESKKGVLEGFYVNHPSSSEKFNWKNEFVNLEKFNNSFSGNYISFRNKRIVKTEFSLS